MSFITQAEVLDQFEGANATDNGDLINEFIAAVESIWDDLTSRQWATGTHTEYFSGDGARKKFCVKNYPVTALTSVHDSYDRAYDSADLIDADDYSYRSETGIVSIDYALSEGNDNVKIVYTAGYTSETVPAWLKQRIHQQSFLIPVREAPCCFPIWKNSTLTLHRLVRSLFPMPISIIQEAFRRFSK